MSSKLTPTEAELREQRLKAALKANLGRRKLQAKDRAKAKALKQAGDKAPNKKE